MKWQSIESAPKDGTRILIYQPDGRWQSDARHRRQYVDTAYWHQPANREHSGYWCATCMNVYRPSHWMPLPDPPVVPKESAE